MIDEHTSLKELAAIVSEALENAGITATLSGGAAVSIYSDNKYESEDLDLDFPPAPLSFGGTYVDPSNCARIDTGLGYIRVITPTHSVMDRLIAAAAWNEPQSLDQALLVTAHCIDKIDWRALDEWVASEGIQSSKEIVEYYEKIARKRPT
jgi:hypothetical protein